MHSSLVRLQNVFGFFTTVAFTTAVLVALSVTLAPQSPSARIDLRHVRVQKGRPHYHSAKTAEYAQIYFDLDADFSSLFNWNTKQLFVYIIATWPSNSLSPGAPPSQAVIWDAIINSPSQSNPFNPLQLLGSPPKKSKKAGSSSVQGEGKQKTKPGNIRLRDKKPKYQITDISGKIASRENVTLEVGWNVQPWVGALTWTHGEGKRFGRWDGIKGGKSSPFSLPALVGKSVGKDKPRPPPQKPKPAEASAVI